MATLQSIIKERKKYLSQVRRELQGCRNSLSRMERVILPLTARGRRSPTDEDLSRVIGAAREVTNALGVMAKTLDQGWPT